MKRYPEKCCIYYPESRQELILTCFKVLCLSQSLSKLHHILFSHFANLYVKSEYFQNPCYKFIKLRAHNLIVKNMYFAIWAYQYIFSAATRAFHTHPDLSHKNIVCHTNLKVYKKNQYQFNDFKKKHQYVFPNMLLCQETTEKNNFFLGKGFLFIYSRSSA